ncbi:hypothetical protein N7491_011327 [Penicillium cf. griseofulvum]|uniref:SH3b domain-containing protein n=1 Tax=Penicillium cf. griseofulvum TaxID=2972120 RepID=A0A9W9JM21_9EURO|nr:hypothetical protein N7472_004672 [Penicillium cf. griseofulvum]KAJ5416425.1 hypothetical protein N7491_011327 [Penicillium cf. griseofulvum]KAJ5442238.1 hypothetical protein N7445_005245 [Penicillium cf. griseofulvum]
MMFTPILALAVAALTPIVNAYPITGDTVNCRSGPGTSHSVVKSYKKGADVAITCQAPGTTVNGNEIWDKTSDGCYISDYYIRTGSSDYVTKKCGSEGGGDGGSDGGSGEKLPGLTSTQSKHAKDIIGEAKKEGLGRQGCLAGIATGLVESNLLIYANKKVPASLKYPHDAVGSDYDSVGIFQQRAVYYPDIAADMDAAKSAAQFFKEMKGISGWKSMDVGKLCQKVQRSAYPSRYAERVGDAKKICAAGGL